MMTRNTNNAMENANTPNIGVIKVGPKQWGLPTTEWSLEEVIEAAIQLTTGTNVAVNENTPYEIVANEETGSNAIVFTVPQAQPTGTKGSDDADGEGVEETPAPASNIGVIKVGPKQWGLPTTEWSLEEVIEAAIQLTTGTNVAVNANTPYEIVANEDGTNAIVFTVPQAQPTGTKGVGIL